MSKVRAIPLLMIPPQINRHYIIDLAPGRSLVEFAVSQGIQVFMIVWRNPSSLLGHGSGLATAAVERGSWWRPWTEWLIARSGNERQACATLGNRQYPPLGPAPGTYVYE